MKQIRHFVNANDSVKSLLVTFPVLLYTLFMQIRKTTAADIPAVMAIYAAAQDFMKTHGNPTQWGTFYPEQSMIENDIHEEISYVCTENGKLAATFAFKVGQDATYAQIYDGAWLNEKTYGVVHRIASARLIKGSARFCLAWAFSQCGNI